MREKIKNLKIKKKLSLIVRVIIAMMLVSAITSIVSLLVVNNKVKNFKNGLFMEKEYVMELNRLFERTQKFTFLAIASKSKDEIEEFIQSAKGASEETKTTYAKLELIYSGDEALLKEFKASMDNMVSIREEIWAYTQNQKKEEATNVAIDEWTPALRQASIILTAIRGPIEQSTNDMVILIQNITIVLLAGIVSLVVVAIIISMLLSKIVTKSITEPVNEVMKVADFLSHGNFDVDVTYESEDEIGETSNALRIMVSKVKLYIKEIQRVLNEVVNKNLKVTTQTEFEGIFIELKDSVISLVHNQNDLMNQLHNASKQVSVGAEQLSIVAQDLAEGSTEQASAIDVLLATVTDVVDQVTDFTETAQKAGYSARVVGEKSLESSNEMCQMIAAMERINQASGQIEAIINTIEEIASQTNLLSLNAAIEAARVGDVGKGFAVVAGEIRELANQSAKAALNTRKLIETTIAEVNNGNRIADSTAQAMKAVNEGIENVVVIIERVQDSALQQLEQMKQVTQTVEQISSVVQNTSSTSEESSATSEELNAQASALNSLTEDFILMD